MLKYLASLVVLALSIVWASAQISGPGPGPVPGPWVISGSAISYGGCVDVPVSVSGGCMGNGTGNFGALYVGGVSVWSGPYTVSTLPTCNSGARGARSYVTDATTPAFLATLVGAGSVVSPAFCNGTTWISG